MVSHYSPKTLLGIPRKLPLRIVLVVSFVVQVVAAVGLTAGLSLRNGQKAVNDLAVQLSEEHIARIQEHLNAYLLQPNLLQRSSRSLLLYNDLDVADFTGLSRYFWHQLHASDGITSMYLGRPNGEFVGVQERDGGQLVLWEVRAESAPQRTTYRLGELGDRREAIATQDYDPRQRPWYQAVLRNGRSSWSPIYEFASQDYSVLGITLAAPVYDERGEMNGVIALDMTLEQISQYLRALRISPNGEAFIMERSGQVVATSTDEPPFLALETGEQQRLDATASQDPMIRSAAQGLLDEFGSLDRIARVQQLTLGQGRDRQLVQVVPFRDGRGLDWLIVTIIPESDFLGQIADNTRTTLILCLVSLIVASAIAGITARWVVQPILRLNAAAKKLEVGEWDQNIPPARFEELSELANAFQSMAHQLKHSFGQLEERNQELQRLDKLKDEFLANTSHELRTPLNGIIGLAESLIDGASGPLPRQTKGNLAMIVASGRRLSTLVNDILDFSQLRHNRVSIKPRAIGIREVTDVVLTLSRPLAREKEVQLINAVSPRLPAALADENRLQQILHNLIGNAVKFTDFGMIGVSARIVRVDQTDEDGPIAPITPPIVDEDGEPRSLAAEQSPAPPTAPDPGAEDAEALVATAIADPLADAASVPVPDTAPVISLFEPQPGDYLAITVSDTGIGIAADQIDRIFEPFEQADGSTGRLYGGMGIGLAVTKQLVELHGGTLNVVSAVGVGSQFTFTLPIAPSEFGVNRSLDRDRGDAGIQARAIADLDTISADTTLLNPANLNDESPILIGREDFDPSQHEFLVLVVDDEPVNRQVIVNHLSLNRYRVVQASNGPEALAMLANGLQPDVMVLDVMMPRMTGYEVCRHVREQYPAYRLPVLMLTAKNQVADLVEGLSVGANDFLTKPISKSELVARLSTHLQLSKITQAYSRFVPREFLQFLKKDSIVDVDLGDQVEHHMSVLFADIRDFTSLSEQMTPEENFRFINAFLSRMEPAIAENHGFIDKYIGDAIMALFSRGADDALQASIAMLHRLKAYNHRRSAEQRPSIDIGIGINTGQLMLGTVGGRNRMDGTVISDTVNVAARIERMTRAYDANLLISHHTFMQLENPNQYALRVIDRVQVKGKQAFVSVYEVFEADPPAQREAKLESKTFFETGLLFFYQQRYAEAAQHFQPCLDICPQDSVAAIYAQYCQNLLQ